MSYCGQDHQNNCVSYPIILYTILIQPSQTYADCPVQSLSSGRTSQSTPRLVLFKLYNYSLAWLSLNELAFSKPTSTVLACLPYPSLPFPALPDCINFRPRYVVLNAVVQQTERYSFIQNNDSALPHSLGNTSQPKNIFTSTTASRLGWWSIINALGVLMNYSHQLLYCYLLKSVSCVCLYLCMYICIYHSIALLFYLSVHLSGLPSFILIQLHVAFTHSLIFTKQIQHNPLIPSSSHRPYTY